MRRTLLLALLVAGCAAPAPASLPPEAALPVVVTADRCREVFAVATVDAARARALVPDAYALATTGPLFLDVPLERAVAGVAVQRCEGARVGATPVEIGLGFVVVLVDDPADAPDVDARAFSVYVVETIATDARLAAALGDAGWPTAVGATTWEAGAASFALRHGALSADGPRRDVEGEPGSTTVLAWTGAGPERALLRFDLETAYSVSSGGAFRADDGPFREVAGERGLLDGSYWIEERGYRFEVGPRPG